MITWREILEFEASHPEGATKARAVRERFGASLTAYYQDLQRALDEPEAERAFPELVGRLKRIRHRRRSDRWVPRVAGGDTPGTPPLPRQTALDLDGSVIRLHKLEREVGAALGEAELERGIARVTSAASDYVEGAVFIGRLLAAAGKPFTAIDVREAAGDPPKGHENAMGAVFRILANRGLIRPFGAPVKSDRKKRHRGLVRVWIGTSEAIDLGLEEGDLHEAASS